MCSGERLLVGRNQARSFQRNCRGRAKAWITTKRDGTQLPSVRSPNLEDVLASIADGAIVDDLGVRAALRVGRQRVAGRVLDLKRDWTGHNIGLDRADLRDAAAGRLPNRVPRGGRREADAVIAPQPFLDDRDLRAGPDLVQFVRRGLITAEHNGGRAEV